MVCRIDVIGLSEGNGKGSVYLGDLVLLVFLQIMCPFPAHFLSPEFPKKLSS